MRLLLDQNLSPRLVAALADLYPGSGHVRDLGLASATDEEVWGNIVPSEISLRLAPAPGAG